MSQITWNHHMEGKMNAFENIPYHDEKMDNRKIVDENLPGFLIAKTLRIYTWILKAGDQHMRQFITSFPIFLSV